MRVAGRAAIAADSRVQPSTAPVQNRTAASKPGVAATATLANAGFVLHPVQAAGSDAMVRAATHDQATGAFSVPARTVAVFVQN